MFLYYIYDGTFEGLLTTFAEALPHQNQVAGISPTRDLQPDLFTEIVEITTNQELSARFFGYLSDHFSQRTIKEIGYCILAEERGLELIVLKYLTILLQRGEALKGAAHHPIISKIRSTAKRVAAEIHRLYGFLRFRQLPNRLFYGAIAPKYNITGLLATHFTARFADQLWLIHDTKRNIGLYYNGQTCTYLQKVELPAEIVGVSLPPHGQEEQKAQFYAESEINYQKLWNEYFQKIAITERKNPKLQRQHLPQHYWSYLVEKVDSK